MEFKDYTTTPGVKRTATQGEIKRAYRKLARKSRPRRHTGQAPARRYTWRG